MPLRQSQVPQTSAASVLAAPFCCLVACINHQMPGLGRLATGGTPGAAGSCQHMTQHAHSYKFLTCLALASPFQIICPWGCFEIKVVLSRRCERRAWSCLDTSNCLVMFGVTARVHVVHLLQTMLHKEDKDGRDKTST